jgi:acetolactate synthase-1/2/3 large subunit
MRVADYLVRRLADLGVEHVFMLPGGGAMHLNDALTLEPRITAVPCHHEQACGIAAEAYGRVKETFGVAMVTTGPGATNIITPVVGAWIESVPMLVISGQVKTADRLRGRPLRQTGVQEVDIVPMVRHCTKYAVTLDNPAHIRRELERAIHEMLSGRKGPVWIDVPLDIQGAQVAPESLESFVPPPVSEGEGQLLSAAVERVIELLSTAERPLILAGHGIRLAGAARRFRELVELLGVPVVTTWNALDLLPWDHPLCVGRPGVVASRAPNFAVQNCDLLIAIGTRLDNVITAYNPRGFARGAKKVVVDVDPHELAKLDMEIALAVPVDARRFVEALLSKAGAESSGGKSVWLSRCRSWKQRYAAEPITASPGVISHQAFVAALSSAALPGSVVSTGSSGLAIEAFYLGFRNKSEQRVFLTSGLGSMGYGLPAAIGSCLAAGARPMICVEGDGSLMLNVQELATLKGQGLPICLIVMNNGGYCSIRNTQRNYFESRFIGTDPAHRLWMPDLGKVAEAFDLPWARIESPETLEADLQNALAIPRPCIVDVHLAKEEQLTPKAAALPQADGAMLSMPLEDMSPLLSLADLKREMVVPLAEQSLAARRSCTERPGN